MRPLSAPLPRSFLRAQPRISLAIAGLWLAGVLAGAAAFARWGAQPGDDSAAPQRWPAATAIARAPDGISLLVFAHPKCPCTAATITELARLMTVAPPTLTASVIFLQPPGVEESWTQTRLWEAVRKIPRVRRIIDREGREARRFGASTAGRTLVYAASGELLFAGGITASRGHEGDNAGASAVLALLRGGAATTTRTATFGCPLFSLASRTP